MNTTITGKSGSNPTNLTSNYQQPVEKILTRRTTRSVWFPFRVWVSRKYWTGTSVSSCGKLDQHFRGLRTYKRAYCRWNSTNRTFDLSIVFLFISIRYSFWNLYILRQKRWFFGQKADCSTFSKSATSLHGVRYGRPFCALRAMFHTVPWRRKKIEVRIVAHCRSSHCIFF